MNRDSSRHHQKPKAEPSASASRVALRREALASLPRTAASNASWLLRRGLEEVAVDNPGDAKRTHINATCAAARSATGSYRPSFERWRRIVEADTDHFTSFSAETITRLFIGMAGDSALETGITLHHVHGMPMVPGSACKGAARAWASVAGLQQLAINALFGAASDNDEAESGLVTFCDALWTPDDNDPLVAEVVTPHHSGYYGNEGKTAATDFDSPIPSSLIAARGRFLFVLRSTPEASGWRSLAATLLKGAMQQAGIGGKTTSGYGFFEAD